MSEKDNYTVLLVKFYVSRWLDGQIAIEKNAITPDVREG